MRIIISPAKKMNIDTDSVAHCGLPQLMESTEILRNKMRELSLPEAASLWKCNDKLAMQNYERFQKMNLQEGLTPAILSYEGIQYQYMAPTVFEASMLEYIQKHLRILSGFYGVLKPMDGVTPYRLEMQAKLQTKQGKNLYEFWGDALYQNVAEVSDIGEGKETLEHPVIINLASKEYAMCIEKYLAPDDIYITCIFGEMIQGKVVQKGTYAKMARGEMVRFMAERGIEDVEEIKGFDRLGYLYNKEQSTEKAFVFLRNYEGEE